MKKNLFKIAFVAVFGIAVSYNVYSLKGESELSNLMLDNVEALASGESGGYTGCKSGGGYCAIYWNGQCIFSSYSHYPY